MPKRIIIRITTDGKMDVATDGFVGKACIEEAGKLMELMKKEAGIDDAVEKIAFKEEYYGRKERNKVVNRN